MANLKDIAKAVGVSARTVSRALNNTGYVSRELQERIQTVAQAMNYSPNRAAQMLRCGHSRDIWVMSWSFDELCMQKVGALEVSLAEHGYQVLLHSMRQRRRSDALKAARKIILQSPAAVVIISGDEAVGDLMAHEMVDNGIKVVFIDRNESEFSRVSIDRGAGVYESVKYLARDTAGVIAYAGGGNSGTGNDWTRLGGYRKAMVELGRQPLELYPSGSEDVFSAGIELAGELADMKVPAVQCFSDVLAMGVLHGLSTVGVRVPDDIRVVGFDNRHFSEYSSPPLTTVSQPNILCGQTAAKILLSELVPSEDSIVECNPRIPTSLIIRQSS